MYEGQGQSTATGVPPARHIPQSIVRLDEEIDINFQLVDQLEKMLTSILAGPSQPQAGNAAVSQNQPRAGLADVIYGNANRIGAINERLRDISSRLQL